MVAEFVDELPERSKGGTHGISDMLSEFAGELLANPGRWAKYPNKPANANSAHSTAKRINDGASKAFSGRRFEAAVRKGVLYVRAKNDA